MSSATSGSVGDSSGQKNYAEVTPEEESQSGEKQSAKPGFAATTSVAAEAEQGDGPAAASASSSAVGDTPSTSTVSVVVGKDYAAAACDVGVAVVGPNSASAASQIGAVAAAPDAAAATCNAANGSRVAIRSSESVKPDTSDDS
ncbi:hypothetical protein J057_02470 [Marinobacter nanhaiticus D15-8W]|uniref:Uncharacterized protein n=2 Tax=Marinobacter TaxID=2742 RepID=N6X611_9GAMM|nr:hypothetical protein J057_02470 [Marinobacter nanhaiticus D15-8W]